jgi:cell division protein FtsQ
MAGVTRPRPDGRTNTNDKTRLEKRKKDAAKPFWAVFQPTRNRRTRRSKVGSLQGLKGKKGHAARSESRQPPVLVRSGFQDMATPSRGAVRRRSKEPRRRFDLTLNVPGAEVRLPSIPVIHFSWRIASSLLLVMMACSLYLLFFSPTFQADVLEVEGMQRLTMGDLRLVINITGEPVISLDPNQIREDLLVAFPDLKEARVAVSLPASVKLTLEERVPVVSWKRGAESVWVDQEGIIFPPRGEAVEPLLEVIGESLPLVSLSAPQGEQSIVGAPNERLDPQMIQVLLSMSQYMPQGAEMVFDSAHGFGWSDDRGWKVYFGNRMSDIEDKLFLYQAIVERLQAEGISPALISMEYLHAPYYRMEH